MSKIVNISNFIRVILISAVFAAFSANATPTFGGGNNGGWNNGGSNNGGWNNGGGNNGGWNNGGGNNGGWNNGGWNNGGGNNGGWNNGGGNNGGWNNGGGNNGGWTGGGNHNHYEGCGHKPKTSVPEPATLGLLGAGLLGLISLRRRRQMR